MTAHVNEFDPRPTRDGSPRYTKGVEVDPLKLKFNNIQSCIAVGLVPAGPGPMIGVHFTTNSTSVKAELEAAITRINELKTAQPYDAFLVANFNYHQETALVKMLKKICGNVYLCHIQPKIKPTESANVDVKMVKSGNGAKVYIREHVVLLKDRDLNGELFKKPKYRDLVRDLAARTAFNNTGKQEFMTDRLNKPWMPAPLRKL